MAIWGQRIGLLGDFAKATNTDNYIAYFLIGAVYWNYVEAVWGIAFNLRAQMLSGTLENLWATAVPRLGIIFAWSLARLLAVTFYSVIAILIVGFTVGLDMGANPRWSIAAGIFVLSLLASYGFAFLLFGLTLRFRDADSIISLVGNAAPLLGGVLFPVTLLPLPLRLFSYAFPFTWGADALRGVLLGAETILPLKIEMTIITFAAPLYLALGWIALVVLERRARHRGLAGF
jgi:ABC-2 type transport system permease protein